MGSRLQDGHFADLALDPDPRGLNFFSWYSAENRLKKHTYASTPTFLSVLVMADFDVVVCGGGPAGLTGGWEAGRRGCRVLILEEHPSIGLPERCAGLLSLSGLERLSLPLEPRFTQNTVRGAVFFSPGGRSFTVDAGKPVAAVVSRRSFDQHLARRACRYADLRLKERVTGVFNENKGVVIRLDHGEIIHSRFALDAEGRGARIARSLGLKTNPSGWLPAVQALVTNHNRDRDFVYLFFPPYVHGFFAYLVPIDEESGKLGLATHGAPLTAMKKFLTSEFPAAKIVGITGGSVYTSRPAPRATMSRTLVMGDAAGHVKATTGGGVIFGCIGASRAGVSVAKACSDSSVEKSVCQEYDRWLRQNVTRELSATALLRSVLDRLPPSIMDAVFTSIAESGVDSVLSRTGDMDFQRETLVRLTRYTGSPKRLLRVVQSLVSSVLS